MSKTLLEELGGRDAIEVVVAGFYDRVMADDRLRSFFRGTSMSRLQALQVEFFSAALGGRPQDYRGRDLRTAHTGLNIQDAHFDAVAGHLADTLRTAGVAGSLIDRVIAAIPRHSAARSSGSDPGVPPDRTPTPPH